MTATSAVADPRPNLRQISATTATAIPVTIRVGRSLVAGIPCAPGAAVSSGTSRAAAAAPGAARRDLVLEHLVVVNVVRERAERGSVVAQRRAKVEVAPGPVLGLAAKARRPRGQRRPPVAVLFARDVDGLGLGQQLRHLAGGWLGPVRARHRPGGLLRRDAPRRAVGGLPVDLRLAIPAPPIAPVTLVPPVEL